MEELELQRSLLTDELLAEQNRKKYDLQLHHVVKYLESFFGDVKEKENRERLLDILIDKIYIDDDKLTATLHFTDDKRELPYKETMEMIEGRRKLIEMIEQPMEGSLSPELKKTAASLIGEDPDFFQ